MQTSRGSAIRAIWRNNVVRYGTLGVGSLAVWDTLSSQFNLPKIPEVWNMTGGLLPWWGWLLLLQAIFVYGLFEYVRVAISPPPLIGETSIPKGNSVQLAKAGLAIVTRIRRHRSATWAWRDKLEPPTDIWRSAMPVLVEYEKAGFPTPDLKSGDLLNNLVGLDEYFSTLIPFLSARQFDEALELAERAAKLAEDADAQFNPHAWFTR